MNAITIDVDGIEFKVEGCTTGDLVLSINAPGSGVVKDLYLSPETARCLGIALQAIADKDPE